MSHTATKTFNDTLAANRTVSSGSIRVDGVVVANDDDAAEIRVDFTNTDNDHTYLTIVCGPDDTERGYSCPFLADRGGFVARPTPTNADAFVSVAFGQDGA